MQLTASTTAAKVPTMPNDCNTGSSPAKASVVAGSPMNQSHLAVSPRGGETDYDDGGSSIRSVSVSCTDTLMPMHGT